MAAIAPLVLALVVDRPGECTAEDVARELFAPPRLDLRTPPTRERILAWRAALLAHERALPERTRRVSRALGKLQERGLVETRAPVRIASWFLDREARVGTERAIAAVHPDRGEALGRLDRYIDMLDEVRGEKSPGVRQLCRTTARERRYARLVRLEVLVPPSLRRPTEAGRALVLERRGLRRVVETWHCWEVAA